MGGSQDPDGTGGLLKEWEPAPRPPWGQHGAWTPPCSLPTGTLQTSPHLLGLAACEPSRPQYTLKPQDKVIRGELGEQGAPCSRKAPETHPSTSWSALSPRRTPARRRGLVLARHLQARRDLRQGAADCSRAWQSPRDLSSGLHQAAGDRPFSSPWPQ